MKVTWSIYGEDGKLCASGVIRDRFPITAAQVEHIASKVANSVELELLNQLPPADFFDEDQSAVMGRALPAIDPKMRR